MQIKKIPSENVFPAAWNANEMDPAMLAHLSASIGRFGLVSPLVVRRIGTGRYETIGGSQRLKVLKDAGTKTIPCVVFKADDARARVLSQGLNHIHGSDNLGLRAELLRQIQKVIPAKEVLSILPETAQSLAEASKLGQMSLDDYLTAQKLSQRARLHHFTVQLTAEQAKVVEEAFNKLGSHLGGHGGSNNRGAALYWLCQKFLKSKEVK
jgi:ParB family chromosome partitioning protein